MYDIVQSDKLNSMADNFEVSKSPCLGKTKYNILAVVSEKVAPLKERENGKLTHKYPICGLKKVSWGTIDVHIKYEHFNKSYSCQKYGKKCKSIDGIRRHTKNCKIEMD